MSNAVVKYHNDFNKIKLPNFTEQEQNLLFGILTKVKEKKSGEIITLYPQDLKIYSNGNLTNEDIKRIIITLKQKFFKADFTILLKDDEKNRVGYSTINLFTEFTIWNTFKDKDGVEQFDKFAESILFGRDISNLESITLGINPKFEYLINELIRDFTRFELAEFVSLSGKYTKTLYRLLKQYRHSGNMRMQWQEFLHIMDIPKDYTQTNIDKWILKPAIKELTKEKNLFDGTRIPFKNLSYTKLKGKGRGRGGNVIGIEFSFEIEQRYESRLILDQRAEQMEKKIHDLNEHELKKLKTKYEDIDFETDKGESMKIFNLSINKDTKHIEVTFKNRENNTTYTNTYENLSKLNGYLSKFGVIMK